MNDAVAWGAHLGQARHPPSVILPVAVVCFGLFGLLGVAGVVRGVVEGSGGGIGIGALLALLFGGLAAGIAGTAWNRLEIYEHGMEEHGPFGRTRIAFADVTKAKTILGGRGVRRVVATAYGTKDHRNITVSASWTMPDAATRKLDEIARRAQAA